MSPTKGKVDAIDAALRHQLGESAKIWMPIHSRIFGAPPILPFEAMSSWMWRISTRSCLPLKGLLASWGLTTPTFWLDCGVEKIDIEKIAITVMVKSDSLQHLLWPQASILADPEFACLTSEPIHQRPIYRYCEICFRSDPIPYFRQSWRLASSYVCEVHATILRDTCPHCHVRIDISKTPAVEDNFKHVKPSTLRNCGHCCADLTECDSNHLPQDILYQVFARQEEMKYLILASTGQLNEIPSALASEKWNLISGRNSVVDVNNQENTLALLSMLLKPHLVLQLETFTSEMCKKRMRRLIRRVWHSKPTREKIWLSIGLDGMRLFDQNIVSAAIRLMTCQSPIGGTYWWARKGRLKVRYFNKFKRSDLLSSANWISKRGSSKTMR